MTARIRALIVDDEPWARKRVASLLSVDRDFEVAGQARNAAEAIEQIEALRPDVVFLDIQMPDADGFDVLEAIGSRDLPCVVFVTAYDRYALRAFDAQATDYLLKPFDEERFRRTLERVRKNLQLGRRDDQARLRALLTSWQQDHAHVRRLLVRTGERTIFVKVGDVDWFEASGNYVTLHVRRETHLVRQTMTQLEQKLDPDQFARIHRSTIVNMDRVKELRPWFRGEQVLVLTDGTELTVGRAFRSRLLRLIGNDA